MGAPRSSSQRTASGSGTGTSGRLHHERSMSEDISESSRRRSMKLRPHHICCEGFLRAEFPERGPNFLEVEQRVRGSVWSDEGTVVEAIQGVDQLCHVCPHCREDRCHHPRGDEEAVRKWDTILLTGMGISYGHTMTSEEWRLFIQTKMPLDFCRTRCPSKSTCMVIRGSYGLSG
jgi:hypothetical protein